MRLLRLGAASLAVMLLLPSVARAELLRVELKIFGMDWAVCAHAVRVAVRKLEGIESVDVSLERASANIRLRPANRITLAQLRQIIKDNGFSAREAIVTAVGTLVERNGKPALSVDGTSTVWLLTATGAQNAAYADALQRINSKQSGKVEVVGTVARPVDRNDPEAFDIQTLRSASK